MSNAKQIRELLSRHPGLDDDEISRLSRISPRQQVNQICRRLQAQGLLRRTTGSNGKIGNFLVNQSGDAPSPVPLPQPAPQRNKPTGGTSMPSDWIGPPLPQVHLMQTLVLIPCSGTKDLHTDSRQCCPSIVNDLPADLAQRLVDARGSVLQRASLDDRHPGPAWQRYGGTLYRAAHAALASAVERNLHVLILSGGYGVIKACEQIGTYNTRMKLAEWPRGLLGEVLLAYAKKHSLYAVRAFVSQSTDYFKLVRQTPWSSAGLRDVAILAPEATPGAMVKAPRAQGEALAEFLAGRLEQHWKSSDGLALRCARPV